MHEQRWFVWCVGVHVREFCGVHSWQMAQDVGMVCKCCGVIPSSLVRFWGSIPICACFHSKHLLGLVSVGVFLYCCLGMVKEKRGGRGGQGEDAWS